MKKKTKKTSSPVFDQHNDLTVRLKNSTKRITPLKIITAGINHKNKNMIFNYRF